MFFYEKRGGERFGGEEIVSRQGKVGDQEGAGSQEVLVGRRREVGVDS